jgi:hypothetical protein
VWGRLLEQRSPRGGGEGIALCFVAIAREKNILLPSLSPSESRCDLVEQGLISLSLAETGHGIAGLQLEAQADPPILMSEPKWNA